MVTARPDLAAEALNASPMRTSNGLSASATPTHALLTAAASTSADAPARLPLPAADAFAGAPRLVAARRLPRLRSGASSAG